MVEEHHNNQGEQENSSGSDVYSGANGASVAGGLVPPDLESSELSTKQLLDTFPSELPASEVDNFILQQATAAVVGDSSGEHESIISNDDAPTVIPLYNHQREVHINRVFPKMFVAAAVVVLAVVVVPLIDRAGFGNIATQESFQTASSGESEDLEQAASKTVAKAEIDTLTDTSASADIDTENADTVNTDITDTDTADTQGNGLAISAIRSVPAREEAASDTAIANPTANADSSGNSGSTENTTAAEVAADSDAAADLATDAAFENPFTKDLAAAANTAVSSDNARQVQSAQSKQSTQAASLAGDTSADASTTANAESQADESVIDGVARTTIISTESSASPRVVQGINITSAARVQRSVEAENAATVDASTAQMESRAQTSSGNFSSFSASASDASTLSEQPTDVAEPAVAAPAFRRSLQRWKAEILKLSRLGKQQQAQEEYRLFIEKHPQHIISFDRDGLPTQSGTTTVTNELAPTRAEEQVVTPSVPTNEPNELNELNNPEVDKIDSPIIILPAESQPTPEK